VAIQLACLPVDSRCLDFCAGNLERAKLDYNSNMAWTGWTWWIYGLESTDSVELTINYTEEILPSTFCATAYNYPMSTRKSSSTQRDVAIDHIDTVAKQGGSGIKLLDSIMDFWGKAHLSELLPMLANLLGWAGPAISFPIPTWSINPNRPRAVLTEDEQKEPMPLMPQRRAASSPPPLLVSQEEIDAVETQSVKMLRLRK